MHHMWIEIVEQGFHTACKFRSNLRATGPPGSIAAARPLAGAMLPSLPSAGAARGPAAVLKAVDLHPHSSCDAVRPCQHLLRTWPISA